MALWQAYDLQSKLAYIHRESTLVIIKTKGDNIQDLSFDKIEGKGFFTKEIEDALLAHEADIAVHSLKDLPTSSPAELVIAGLSERQDPADVLIARKDAVDLMRPVRLKKNARIGTSSIRRKTQLLSLDPDIHLVDIRGNVPTRLRKINDDIADGVILAAAGLNRLHLDTSAFFVLRLSPEEFVPAPAQGAIAYQCRADDVITRKLLLQIHNRHTSASTNIERGVLQQMGGGCQTPLGVYCYQDAAHNYHCYASKGSLPGQAIKRVQYSSSSTAGLVDYLVNKLKE